MKTSILLLFSRTRSNPEKSKQSTGIFQNNITVLQKPNILVIDSNVLTVIAPILVRKCARSLKSSTISRITKKMIPNTVSIFSDNLHARTIDGFLRILGIFNLDFAF